MKTLLAFCCLMVVVVLFSVEIEGAPQRVRGGGGGSESTSSSTTETAPTSRPNRLRARTHRRSTTPIPAASSSTSSSTSSPSTNPNDDLIRKGLIDKLCKRKYSKGSTTTGSPLLATESVSTLSTSTAAPVIPKRSRSRSRVARRATSTPPPPTFGSSCTDFDELSFEQLINRNKAGLRPVRRRESSLKSDA